MESIIAMNGLNIPMLVAGASIMSGVSLKNTGEPLFGKNLKTPGMILFVGGWLLAFTALYSVYGDIRMIIPIIGIITAAVLMNQKMAAGEEIPKYLPALFVGSWLGFAGLIYLHSGSKLPFAAAALVFFSMMFLLPKERIAGVADGVGMPIFMSAFIILSGVMTINNFI